MRSSHLCVLAILATTVTCRPAGAGGDQLHKDVQPLAALPAGLVHIQVDGDRWLTVRAELATTAESQRRGLMFRESLAEDEGMLFIFHREDIRSFWMKNTLIPLDMVFIDGAGTVVGIVHEAEPLTLDSRTVERPSRYVLELQGGWARAFGLHEGSRIRFDGVPGVAEPFGHR